MNDVAEFVPDSNVTASEIEAIFDGQFEVTLAEAVRATVRFHDTFDWRLYRAGWVVEEEFRGRRGTVRCHDRRQRRFAKIGVPGRLRRLADLQGLENELGLVDHMGLRALMVHGELPCRVVEMRLLNEDRKTVVVCRLERFEPGAGGERVAEFTVVRLFGLRGYTDELHLAAARIAGALNTAEHDDAALQKAMTALGRTVDGYAAKPRVALPPGASALQWACAICTHLVRVMVQNEPGMAQDLDTEFLHDFRVAVRRTRSLLGQVRGVFTPESIAPFTTEFAWLGQVTGPVRDLDVFLLNFDELSARVPPELHEGLDGFHAYLVDRRGRERRKLQRHLRSARYRSLIDRWRTFLDHPPSDAQGAAAHEEIIAVAARETQRVWRRVRKQGRRIDAGSPPEALHDLRKSCKKLRYLLEFFAPLQAGADAAQLVSRLKRLQDNLGEFQDGSVQIAELSAMARELQQAEAVLAIGALAQRASDRRRVAREHFHVEFEQFDRRSTARLFDALYAGSEAA